jgi:hypothetical protein
LHDYSDRDTVVSGAVYYAGTLEQPLFCYAGSAPAGEPETNVEFVPHSVAIRGVRQAAPALRLEVEGAAVFEHRSAMRSFHDETELRRVGYAEAAAIARAATGAAHVVVFDHNVRRGASACEPSDNALPAGPACAHKRPVFHVHTDFTADSAPLRARAILGTTLASARRIAQVNVWRPITGPVRDSPLALCDASSVAPADLVAAELRYPDRTGEIYYVRFNPAHRWYYLPEMRTDEVWVFKNYDAATDGRARFTPHTAFLDPRQDESVPARESIEFRTLAVFAD